MGFSSTIQRCFGVNLSLLKEKMTVHPWGSYYPFEVGLQSTNHHDIQKLPGYVIVAILFCEDAAFFQHGALNLPETKRRFAAYIENARYRGSGSSISQQVVRVACNLHNRHLFLKMKEVLLAMGLEEIFSKEEILSLFLNIVPLGGPNIFGITLGAKAFFDKSPEQLTLEEALYLGLVICFPSSIQGIIVHQGRFDEFNYGRAFTKLNDILLYYYAEFGIEAVEDLSVPSAKDVIERLTLRTTPSAREIAPDVYYAIEQQALSRTLEMKKLCMKLMERGPFLELKNDTYLESKVAPIW